MATKAENDLNRATRAYFRERVTIAGSENLSHAEDCVLTFVRAAVIDEWQRLQDRIIVAEAQFLGGQSG